MSPIQELLNKNNIKNIVLSMAIAFIMSILILWVWNGLHENSELLIDDNYTYIFFIITNYKFHVILVSHIFLLMFLTISCYVLTTHHHVFSKTSLWLLSLIPIIFASIIISLLIVDLTVIFLTFDVEKIYSNIQTKDFLFKLYAAGLAMVVFGVQLYVAYVRGMALKQANQIFEFTQQQFNYTQTQKTNEEIEKRFQEGIKLLGNENESVRLGGIYILWEIVKEAVKALPYITEKYNEHVKLFCRFKDKEFKDNTTINNNTPEISAYIKYHSLHTQILNILCAHIRAQTNSEKYLKQYYPSIYKSRYPKQFK